MTTPDSPPLLPPKAPRKPHAFSHHGIRVEDPYAWLRDPKYPQVEEPEILNYLNAENDYFEASFKPLQPLVEDLFDELKARRPDEDESVPYEKNGFIYQWRFAKNAQYRTWLRAPVTSPDAWVVLLDEAELAEGLDYFSLGALAVSPDASSLIYSIDTDGSEHYTLHAINIDSREPHCAPIENTMGSAVWNAASDAFLYTLLNEQWQPLKAYLRKLDAPEADTLIYHEHDAAFRVGLELSQSEQYVFINTSSHTQSEVYYLPRAELSAEPTLIAPRAVDFEYDVDHRHEAFIIRSNLRQQNFDIYTAPLRSPDTEHWQMLLEGDEQHYITGHLALDDYIVVEERIEGLDQIRIMDLTNDTEHFIDFPEAAYAVGLGINPHFTTHSLRLGYNSMVTPSTIYEYDVQQRVLQVLKVQQIPSGYDDTQFTTERMTATARDGTSVPISIVRHRNTPLDGSAPLYLYGYGAYGYATEPGFSSPRISLLERGFIFAIAHIRGGDELGYHWYTQGKLAQRTNTFNDFVDVARHLIAEGYARAGNIAIAGGSAGGELMGAVVNQAPELWGAVAAHVPFVDVLNTMLDATLPLTPPEWSEWGNPIEDAEAFKLIQSYSPYDQLEEGAYPAMLVTAGLHDPRVTYWEPAKYVARLRTLKTDDNPLLLKTNMEAGHGGKSGRYTALLETAEEYAFFICVLKGE